MKNPKICADCCYRKGRKCTVAKKYLSCMSECPENYTDALITELRIDYLNRRRGNSHGMCLRKEW